MKADKGNPSPAPPPWLYAGRIPSLDGLRACAVGAVVLAHAHQTHGFPNIWALRVLGQCGHVGVDLFFVLSGFLITLLLGREYDRTESVALAHFYLRRVLRIIPAYIAYLATVAVLQFAGVAEVPAVDWLAAGTYTMNFRHRPAWEVGHTWSLSIEEHFYLLWPPLFALLRARRLAWLLVILLVAEPLVRIAILIFAPHESAMTDLWTFTRLDCIAAGCLLAVLGRSSRLQCQLDRVGKFWPAALLTLAAALTCSFLSGSFEVAVAPSMIALNLALIVWATARRAPRWLNGWVIAAVGVGSYSLYLWQQLFLNPRREAWWTTFPQNVLLAALCALASYWLVERPFLRLKREPTKADPTPYLSNAFVGIHKRVLQGNIGQHLSLTVAARTRIRLPTRFPDRATGRPGSARKAAPPAEQPDPDAIPLSASRR